MQGQKKPPVLNTLSDQERAALLASVEGLCRKHAGEAWLRWPFAGTVDDFRQAARMGAWIAATRFQPGHKSVTPGYKGKPVKFSTYATWWIRQKTREYGLIRGRIIRVHISKMRNGSRPAPVLTCQFNLDPETGDEIIPQQASAPDDQHHVSDVGELLKFLPDLRSRFVLRRRFGLDGEAPDNLIQLAEKLDVSRERVRQIEMKAIKRLRKMVGLS